MSRKNDWIGRHHKVFHEHENSTLLAKIQQDTTELYWLTNFGYTISRKGYQYKLNLKKLENRINSNSNFYIKRNWVLSFSLQMIIWSISVIYDNSKENIAQSNTRKNCLSKRRIFQCLFIIRTVAQWKAGSSIENTWFHEIHVIYLNCRMNEFTIDIHIQMKSKI